MRKKILFIVSEHFSKIYCQNTKMLLIVTVKIPKVLTFTDFQTPPPPPHLDHLKSIKGVLKSTTIFGRDESEKGNVNFFQAVFWTFLTAVRDGRIANIGL